ncbi:MAG: hypothetical protein LC137_09320 [Burkholderiales bacterium]|nr:hypothetical protein [Burkholderiales bacterium]
MPQTGAKAAPFTWLGVAAIVAGGALAAAIAHRPAQNLVWLVAYLVLVVGVAQYVLGAGQAALARRALPAGVLWGEWALLNLGHLGVIGGRLAELFTAVLVGTLAYAAALAWFVLALRGGVAGTRLLLYRLFALFLLLSSLVGVALTVARHYSFLAS